MLKPLHILACALLSTILPAQTTTPTLHTSSTLVIVPTLVRRATGELVYTLQPGDFELTDNGVPQRLTLEPHERQPIRLLVVMQTGGAAIRQFPNYLGVATMLESLMGSSSYQASLLTFDSKPEDLWPFSPDIEHLKDGFTQPIPGDSGAAIYDALDYGINLLEQSIEEPARDSAPPRPILLLLSQENDAGSKLREQNILAHLGQTGILVVSVTFSPEKTWFKDQLAHGTPGNPPYNFGPGREALLYTINLDQPLGNALRAMRANAAAQVAAISGGEAISFGNRQDLERQLGSLANDIANRYTLSFQPSVSTPGLHVLSVRLPAQPSLRVSARSSYWSAAAPHQ